MVVLASIIWQDFKYRALTWWILPVLGILAIGNALFKIPLSKLALSTLYNLGIIFLQMTIVFTYFFLRGKSFKGILNQYLGIGDIIFLIILCFIFSPVNYIVFCTISFIIVLLFSIILLNVLPKKDNRIPLAGGVSCVLFVVYILSLFNFNFDFYSDQFVFNIIEKLYG